MEVTSFKLISLVSMRIHRAPEELASAPFTALVILVPLTLCDEQGEANAKT